MDTHTGARAVLGIDPALTPAQWRLVVELLYQEQRAVLAVQRDKAAVLARSVYAGAAFDEYLAAIVDLREAIQTHTGISGK